MSLKYDVRVGRGMYGPTRVHWERLEVVNAALEAATTNGVVCVETGRVLDPETVDAVRAAATVL